MARKVKCVYCGSLGMNDEFYKVPKNEERTRFTYYCSESEYNMFIKDCEEREAEKEALYIEKELNRKKKEEDTKKYNDLMEYIMDDIYNYEKGMVFPVTLVKRIKKLREFYSYEVIKYAFVINRETIIWSIKNKNFKSEYNMTSYIMAIVESKINDIYLEFKRKESQENKVETLNKNVDVELFNDTSEYELNIVPKKVNTKDISQFLDDDI